MERELNYCTECDMDYSPTVENFKVNEEEYYMVSCPECGNNGGTRETEEEAIEDWNDNN